MKIDLIGQKFGRLRVIDRIKILGRIHWKCLCDCGNYSFPRTDQLKTGNTLSCGCYGNEQRHKNLVNLVGKKFGRLTVEKMFIKGTTMNGFSDKDIHNHKRHWICQCECGRKTIVDTTRLVNGYTKSCGCGVIEAAKRPRRYKTGKGVANRNEIIRSYKFTAKKRNLDFTIDDIKLLELFKGICYYCGQKPSNIHNRPKTNGEFIYNGIDRLDNDKGYIEGNVVSCCKTCNMMKKTLSKTEFLNHIECIHYHNHKGEYKNE